MAKTRLKADVSSSRVYLDDPAGVWCFVVYFGGNGRVRKRGGRTRQDATEALAGYLQGLEDQETEERLSSGVRRFLARPDLSPSTVTNYGSTLRRFLEFVGDLQIPMVTEQEIRDFVDLRRREGRLQSTIHADVRRVRALMRWLGVEGYPGPKRLGVRTPGGRLDFFSLLEVRNLLKWADGQEAATRALIYAYIFTGGRAREVLALERSDVDLQAGWITFRLGLKHGAMRRVPIAEATLDPWRRLFEDRRGRLFPEFTYHRAYRLWKRACVGAGVRVLTLHHARHTCASLWVMAGIDIVTVRNWLGHSSIQQTMVYSKISPEHGEDAMARFREWISPRLK